MRPLYFLLAVLAVSLVSFSPLIAAEMITGRATVIDGDTLEIKGKRIRLRGGCSGKLADL